MRAGVNLVVAYSVLAVLTSGASSADDLFGAGWVPSLAITSGASIQRQSGFQYSTAFDGETNTTTPLRPSKSDRDEAASAYVGGALELLTPALPLPASPRFFAAGELLPTFAPERQVQDGEPSRIRGPEPEAVIAVEETPTHHLNRAGTRGRGVPFGETEANGDGMRLRFQVEQLVYGAKAGVAFAFELRGRQLRLKPSVGWIHYEVEAKGQLVHPQCSPTTRCTNTYRTDGTLVQSGFLREVMLSADESKGFDGFGPGLDLEMDTGRFGPIGTSLFAGLHAYYIPGDREIEFDASRAYDDQLSPSAAVDVTSGFWRLRVAPWFWRAGVGIRFHWLGSSD